MIRSSGRTGQPFEGFCHPHEQRGCIGAHNISRHSGIVVSRTEPLYASRGSEYASAPQDLLNAIERADRVFAMIPAPCVFSRSPCALKLTAACTITASSLTGICSQMHVDRRAVGAVVVPVGLAFVVITIVVVVIALMIPMLTCKLARLRS